MTKRALDGIKVDVFVLFRHGRIDLSILNFAWLD